MSYDADHAWQKEVRDRVLKPGFYEQACPGRYRFIDGDDATDRWLQREYGDTIIDHEGLSIFVEEKIVRWPGFAYKGFSLETENGSLDHRVPGWMVHLKADWLLYCYYQPDDSLKVWWVDFPALKAWFWDNENKFPIFRSEDRHRLSKGRVVERAYIREAKIRMGHCHCNSQGKMKCGTTSTRTTYPQEHGT